MESSATYDAASAPFGDATNGHAELLRELWQAAVDLRGSIEPADSKRYVLPILFPPLPRRRPGGRAVCGQGVLRRNQVDSGHFDRIVGSVMKQAAALYRDWPAAA